MLKKFGYLVPLLAITALLLGAVVYIPTWTYLSGRTSFSTDYNTDGVPFKTASSARVLDATTLTHLKNTLPLSLPETVSAPFKNYSALDLTTDDRKSYIKLTKPANVYVTFISEGAGYRNSLGFFTFTNYANLPSFPLPNNTNFTTTDPLHRRIIFPNTSLPNSGGNLTAGTTVQLVDPVTGSPLFQPGNNIGFFVLADGSNIPPTTVGIKNYLNDVWMFYTIKKMNPETGTLATPRGPVANSAHTVLLYDKTILTKTVVVLGMEDMNRNPGTGCDNDFNDVLFAITTNPPDAIDTSSLNVLPPPLDSDKDGIPDANDAYPNDAARAFNSWFPSSNGVGTLAYEDLWPDTGDYDLNDMVVSYRFNQVLDYQNFVKDIIGTFQITAVGAYKPSGFAIEIPGVVYNNVDFTKSKLVKKNAAGTVISTTSLTVWNTVGSLTNLVVQLFADSRAEVGLVPGDGNTFNTKTKAATLGPIYELTLTLKTSLAKTTASPLSPPHNPFIYESKGGVEVHLPSFAATSFGQNTYNTRTPVGNSVKYMTWTTTRVNSVRKATTKNLPWAINIPFATIQGTPGVAWKHPKESVDILKAYPQLQLWSESGGNKNTDWYLLTNAVLANIIN
jgi:LruC domain-containing protein